MKNLLLIIFTFFYLTSYSQIDYPIYQTDSLGQVVVVMTIQQAQALDNSTDLLSLFEKLNAQIGTYDSACLKVVNDKDEVIASQDLKISEMKNSIANKQSQIDNLSLSIKLLNEKIASYERTLETKEKEISLHKKEIKKTKKVHFAAGTVFGIIVTLASIILLQ